MSLLALALVSSPPLLVPQEPFAPPRDLLRAIGPARAYDFADLDGDGDLDALTVGVGVYFIPGLDAAAFDQRTAVGAAPTEADEALFGDVDGDGVLDVVTLTEPTGGVDWSWFSTSDGGQSFDRRGGGLLLDGLTMARLDDLDGDGDEDLLGRGGAGLVWFENLGGTFGSSAVSIDPGPLPDDLGRRAFDLLDVDGDGAKDLFVASNGARPARVSPGLVGGGFGPPVDVASGLDEVFAADVDLDGDADLVARDGNRLVLLENTGGFTFAAPSLLSAPSPLPYIELIRAFDADGDGDQDLLALDFDAAIFNANTLYLENAGGVFTPRLAADLFAVGNGFDWRDVDGDGDLDQLSPSTGGLSFRRTRFAGGALTLDPAELVFTSDLPFVAGLVTCDFDGDGDRDIVLLDETSSDSLLVLESLGSGVYAPAREVPAPAGNAFGLTAGDIDGDGREDLLVDSFDPLGRILLAAPGGFVDSPQQPGSVGTASAITGVSERLVDVDSDGDLDLLTATPVPASLSVMLSIHWNDGSGGGWARTDILDATSYALFDVDGDGTRDLLTARGLVSTGSGTVMVNQVLGPETLGPDTVVLPGAGLFYLETVDVDGDGNEDLVFNASGSGVSPSPLRFAPGGPGGSFGPTSFEVVGGVIDVGPVAGPRPVFGDVDRDGRVDLVSLLPSPPFRAALWRGAATGGFGAPELLGAPESFYLAEDVDLDGDIDLLSYEDFSSSTVWFQLGNARAQEGEPVCGPANVNATGGPARLLGFGSADLMSQDLELRAVGLPANTLGIFAASMTVTAPTPVAGSAGDLCLGGSIGRYDAPGQILNAGPGGQFALVIDPAAIEQPLGPQAAQVGESWAFQAWFRDVQGGAATSNFSDALVVTF